MRIILIQVSFFFFYSIIAAQCPQGDIQFTTQRQVDEFAKNYPNCSGIAGNVMIGTPYGPTDIRDLSALEHIRTIDGYLNISNNPELPTLKGLDSLETLGGYLCIFNDDKLTTLNGLSNLTSINGFLWIIHNQTLTAPDGLQKLTSVNGSIEISHNPGFISLAGLENIKPETINPTLSFVLTPVIDFKMINNGAPVIPLPSNIVDYQEQHSIVNRFRNMIQKSYVDRAIETDMIYKRIDDFSDPVELKSIIEIIADIARDSGDEMMVWESELINEKYNFKFGTEPVQQRIDQMKAFAMRAGEKGIWQVQARALILMVSKYWFGLQDYEKTFKTHHAIQKVLDRMSPEEFPDIAQCYTMMGMAHYRFRDYQTAIRYFKKAISTPESTFNATYIKHGFNNLGLCYQKLNKSDSSDYYFHQILNDTIHYPIRIWEGIASGNLGYNYYLRKEYDKAVPLLQRDVGIAESLQYWGLAAGSLIPLADIQLSSGRLSESGALIRRAREYIRRTGEEDRLRLLYPIISKWHGVMGDQSRATDYVDSTLQAIEKYNEKFDALKVMRANQEIHAREQLLNEVERQKLTQQRNLIMTIALIVFISGLIFLWHRGKDLRRKREIRELTLKNTQESLEHARTRLDDLTRKIRENNQLINRLQQNQGENTDPKVLQALQNATILTKADWRQFKNHFQKTYPGFLETLQTRYADLTPAEVRCLCLEKLQLTNLEMAAAQGVSPKSINVTQYRIRRKLGLESQDELEQLVNSIW